MARRNLEVVVSIKDSASQGLDKVKNKVKETGNAANKAELDFTKFNKTLFTTTAFIATFVKGFSNLSNALDQGAELDRLSNQYERVLGPKGKLFGAIDSLTTTTIDKMTVLKEGLKLANLGIANNTDEIADLFSKAGTAAKMAGIDSGEGVKRFTDFLAGGSTGQLEFLGLIARTNPQLQAQMAILGKVGGVMSGVISTQARLTLGRNLLNIATENQLKQDKDLVDILGLAKNNITYLRSEIGILLGKALGPLIDKFAQLAFQVSNVIEDLTKNSKEFVFLVKSVVVATTAIAGLVATMGTLRLAVKLLSFAGIGLPGLILSIITLGGAFLGVTKSADGFINKIKLFGAFFSGIWEMVSNFDPETGMTKMSKSTHDMLEKAGLLKAADTISRIIVIVGKALSDTFDYVVEKAKWVDEQIGGLFNSVLTALGSFSEDWTTWWTTDAVKGPEKAFRSIGVLFVTMLSVFGLKKLWGVGTSLLGKIPGLGGIFGGKGPKGTKSDPMYTRDVDSSTNKGGGFLSTLAGAIFGKGAGSLLDRIIAKGGLIGTIANLPRLLTSSWGALSNTLLGIFGQLGTILANALIAAVPLLGPVLAVAAGAALGIGIGALTNMALDKYTTRKDKYGTPGNLADRTLMALGEWTGIGPARDIKANNAAVDKMNYMSVEEVNTRLKTKGRGPMTPEEERRLNLLNNPINEKKVSPATVPIGMSQGDNSLSTIDKIGETMSGLQGVALEQQRTAVQQALSDNSGNGKLITEDEMFNIMNPGIGYLKQIAENTEKSNLNYTPMRKSPRGP